ncbi:MAG: hypothetical protein ACXAD7_14705 [Candidatus Kariarchaeaceae archaeon]
MSIVIVEKSALHLIVITFLVFGSVSTLAQNTTVWGPGNNYEIAYIHSGKIIYNGAELLEFNNLPVTEFKIKNITNTGYSYIYRGYGNVSYMGSVEMNVINYPGIGSIEFPTGGFPVVLPLSFNGKNDWLVSFAETIKVVSNILTDFNETQLLSATTEIKSETVEFRTETRLNGTTLSSTSDTYLPMIGLDILNGTVEKGSISATISYAKSTGALFNIDTIIRSSNFTDPNRDAGATITITQSLEFVAIIPPAALIEDAIRIDNLWLLSFIFVIPIMKRKNIRVKV